MADTHDHRLEALELKLMEFEVTQNELDAVVIRQAAEIDHLKLALQNVLTRLDNLGNTADGDTGGGDDNTRIEHELPPHY